MTSKVDKKKKKKGRGRSKPKKTTKKKKGSTKEEEIKKEPKTEFEEMILRLNNQQDKKLSTLTSQVQTLSNTLAQTTKNQAESIK
jgi:hypothetical protein